MDQCCSVNKQRQPYYVSVYTSACFSSVPSHRVRLADVCSQHPGHKNPAVSSMPGHGDCSQLPRTGPAPRGPAPPPAGTSRHAVGGRGLAGGGRGLAQAPPPWRVPPRAARSTEPVTEGAANTAGCSELAPRRKRGHSTTLQRHRSAMCR